MAQYLPLPDGSSIEIPEGMSIEEAAAKAKQQFPEAFVVKEDVPEPETGFVAGLKSGFQSLKGDIGAIGAGLGVEGAAEYAKAQREKAAQIAETPELTEDPWGYVTTLLGQSAAYMAAPIAGAALVGSAPVSGALGLGALGAGLLGAGAVSATQFTGSNLSRQLEEGTAPEDLQLGAAVAAAIPQAALDTVALKFIPGINKLVGKFGRELTKEESLNAARKLAEASAAGLIKAGGVKTAQTAGIEGLTEAGQQVFERMQAGLDLMDEQARGEYIDNFVGGATLGGLFGAGSRIGAQGRAKEEVAQEDQRVADEAAAAEQARQDQLALLEGGTETRAVPYAEAGPQGVLPGMEAVEPAAPEAAPVDGAELLQQQQKLQRVLEDNQQQMSDAIEQQDLETYKKLRDQRGVLTGQLQTISAELKASGFEDTASKQVQLQNQLAKAQASLSKMAGPGFDPEKADKLVNRIDELQAQLQEVGGAQGSLLGKDVPMLDLAQRNEQARKDAAQAELDARQADLLGTIPEREQPDPLILLKDAMAADDEVRKQQAFDALFENVFETGADKTVVPVPETLTPMPRQQFKAANNQFNTMLTQVDKLSNSMLASNKDKAQDIRDQINDIREKGDGYLKLAFDARASQDEALNNFLGIMTDIREGVYFGGKGRAPEAASSTLDGLKRQASAARATYIQSALQEAALHRRAEGRPAISQDEALKAAAEMDAAMDAAIDEIATRSEADRGPAYQEEQIVLPAQMRGAQIVRPAVTQRRDVRPLEQRPLGAPRAAQEVIAEGLNVLPQIRQRLIGGRQAVAIKPVLRTQFAATEAAKVAEERGETAKTLKGELARRTESVRNKMSKMRDVPAPAQNVLNEAADVMDAGKASRGLLDAVEGVVDDIVAGRTPRMSDLRAVKDTLKAAEPTAVEQQAAGQKELFGTTTDRRRKDQEVGVIRKDFKALMASPAVRSGQAAVAKAKETIAKLKAAQEAAAKAQQVKAKKRVAQAFENVEEQRGALQEAVDTARMVAAAELRQTRAAIFDPVIDATTKRLETAKEQIQKAFASADQEGITPDIQKRIDGLLGEIEAQEKALEDVQAMYMAGVENADIIAATNQDSLVQFERKVLNKFEADLKKAIDAANLPPAELRAISNEAAAQRARVAKAENDQRLASEKADREQRQLEERLSKAVGVDRIAVINGKKQAVVTAQETERDADARRLQKILNSVDDMVEERKAAKGKRAIGPAVRTQSAAPSTMRSGTEESKAGLGTKGLSQRVTEARGKKQRDVPITSAEMAAPAEMSVEDYGKLTTAELFELQAKQKAQEANRIAEELRNKTPAQKRKEAREAAALAKELEKELIKGRKESDFYDSLDDMDYLREQTDAYDSPSFTPVKINVNKALRSGDAVKAAELLAESGSTPFVRKLAGVLASLLGNVKIEMVSDLHVGDKRAAGNYMVRRGTIQLDEEAVSEEVILHEMIHAATLRALKAPVDTLTDAQKAARTELESMFASVKKNTNLAREYGMTDVTEFAAELLSNRVLQEKLAGVKWTGGGNMFTRFINKVLSLLGLKEGVDFNKQATQNILNLFEKALPMTDGKQIDNVASVLRGVFPNSAPKFDAGIPADVRNAAKAGTAQVKTARQKVDASFFSPSAGLAWRTQLLDRFAPIEALLKKGVERKILPDMQLFQTLYYLRFGEQRSQYVAQAASNGPIQRVKQADGTFTIESVKGENLAKIADTLRGAGIGNEQAAEEMFTTWMAGIRAGQGAIGWDKLNFKDPKTAKANWDKVNSYVQTNDKVKAAFESARKQYRQYNAGLLDFLADSGAMSREEAARLKSLDYVPFYRVDGDAVELMIDKEKAPVRIGNIKDQPYLRELVGGEDAILPFFSSALQNTNLLMDMALRNIQTKDVAHVMDKMGYAKLRKGSGPAGTNIIRYREHGEMMHAVIDEDMDGIPADLLVKGMEGIKATIPAVVRLMQIPANLLRKTVTLMPSYALRQAVRDPLNAWLVTGGNFTPIASSFKELGKMVGGKSSLEDTLQQAGAISSNVFSNDRQDIERILRNVAGGKGGWHKLLAKAEGFAIQGDSATRAVLYNMYRQKGMTHMQALLGSLESMNFSRRGVSPSMQFMSMMVPFFNAQVQGLDVLWRAGKGASLFEKQMQVRQTMLRRGLMMAAGTMAYAALMQDDDTYKNATPEQRALNWFVPIPGADVSLRVPIPFELGYAFKSIPEMFFNVALGDEKAKDAAKAFGSLMYNTVPIGLPQGIKPIVEVAANYSFFTGEPIEYGRMMGLQKSERYGANTTEIAKMLSAVTGSLLSPAQVDYLVRGYTSSLGITLMQIPDIALRPLTDQAERPTKLINEYPVIGTLFQPADGRGVVNAAYDRIEEFQQAKTTLNKLIEEGRQADAKAFAQKYATEIAANSIGGSFRQQMGELAKLKRAVAGSKELTPDQKQAKITQIKKLEIELARRIRAIE